MKNSSAVLRVILRAMTAGDLPTVEVTWRRAHTWGRDEHVGPQLMLVQPGSDPIHLLWHDGLERLAEVLGQALPERAQQLTVVRSGDNLRAVAIR